MLLSEMVERFGGQLEGDGSIEIHGVKGVEFVEPGEATYALDEPNLVDAEESTAVCVIVPETLRTSQRKPLIRCPSPNRYVADLLEHFHPLPEVASGVHGSAVIDATAEIAATAAIGPHATIGRLCRIGERAQLMAGVCLGDDCVVGEGAVLHPNVTVYRGTRIGARVIIHAGATIGADGFGYFPDEGGLRKWPHIGNVVIEDDVEIGANTCIDRGKFGSTLIERGAKIDNLVQVAHNCRVGTCSVLAGQTGLSGSVVLEPGVVCAGQVGIADHVTVGRGAMLAAQTGVIADIEPQAKCLGMPARDRQTKLREWATLNYLVKKHSTLRKLIAAAERE